MCSLFVVAVCLLAPPPASAAGSRAGNRELQERTARKACLAGEYEKGVEILAELFIDTGDITYIYNQGRCFEQADRYQDAIRRFQEYLRANKKLSREEQADARKHIDDCQELLAKESPPSTAAPAVASVVQQQPAAVPAPAPMQPSISIQQPSADGPAGSALRTTGLIAASTGGALLITGVVLNLKVNGMSRDLESYYQTSTNSRRETYKTLSQVSYGVGAACVAGGAVLYYLGWNKAQTSSASVALVPAVAPGEVGALVGGTF